MRAERGELIRDNGGIQYIELHPEFRDAAQLILKSATRLLQADSAKLVLRQPEARVKVLRYGGDTLLPRQKDLVGRCMRDGETFYYTDSARLVGQSQSSEMSQAWLFAPLRIGENTLLGVLVLERSGSVVFNETDTSLIESFSKVFARLIYGSSIDSGSGRLVVQFSSNVLTLLENLALYRNNLQNNFILAEMIRVSKMINSTLELPRLLESIIESSKLVLQCEAASLMLIDHQTNELYFDTVTGGKGTDLKQIRLPIGVGIAGLVAESRQPAIVNDAQNDERVFREADQRTNFITRNLIAVPLMVRQRIIGVLEVINCIGRPEWGDKDLELFQTFAEHAALAIHNRELIDSLQGTNREMKKKVHELSSLHEVSKALLATLNEKDLFDSIVRIVADELDAERVSILLYTEEEDALQIISHHGLGIANTEGVTIDVNRSLSGIAFRENRVVFSNQIENSEFSVFRNHDRYYTGMCILHPLSQGSSVYGVLNIAEKSSGPFTEDDLRLVSTICGQITKGIQNFRLLDAMIEKRSYEKELEITSSIQKAILPERRPEAGAFDLGVLSVPAKMMGGDFYDYYRFSDEEYGFLVADVSGKSLPAALFMAVSSSVIRTTSRSKSEPRDVMSLANDLIYENSQSGMFVTVFYCVYDLITRALSYSSCGHNEQLVYRQDNQGFEILQEKGRPLGVLPNSEYGEFREAKIYLKPGDILILYTDGVTEMINEKREEYGLQRFQDSIRAHHLLPADQMARRIYRDVSEFAGREPQFDDFTLMVVKIQ